MKYQQIDSRIFLGKSGRNLSNVSSARSSSAESSPKVQQHAFYRNQHLLKDNNNHDEDGEFLN